MNKHSKRLLTLVALATTTTATIHIINKVIAASACLKEMLDTDVRNYYHWRFGDIYYTKKGKGSPILLIHDMLPGGSGYEWTRIEDELALEHTVYNLDLPGCGRSEKPGMTYTNFVYVQAICDFIKNVIGEKTDVIVNGYSASFVVMACHNEKTLFDKIMMVNPVSLASLKQMPGKKEKLLRFRYLEHWFIIWLYQEVQSMMTLSRTMHLIRSIRIGNFRMHIMKRLTEADATQKMSMQIKRQNI